MSAWELFALAAAPAAIADLTVRRIPNFWLISWFFAGLAAAFAGSLSVEVLFFPDCSAGWERMLLYAGRAGLVLLIGKGAWRLKVIGAGDVKLLALAGAMLGLKNLLWLGIFSLAAGAGLSVIRLAENRNAKERFGYFFTWLQNGRQTGKLKPYMKRGDWSEETTIPFAAAVWLGYLMVLIRNRPVL